MELLLELALTVSLSLMLTFLVVKLVTDTDTNTDTDNGKHELIMATEAVKLDKLQWMPFEGDMIKLQDCQIEGKSFVEFHRSTGVDDGNKFQDVVVNEEAKEKDIYEKSFQLEEYDGLVFDERKSCEIEIESVVDDDDDGKLGITCGGEISDWEEIGRHDYEDLLVDAGK